MFTLYYAPKACSLAPHVLLEEAGLPYRAEHVDIFAGEAQKPAYLAVNPRGQVPALRLESGEVLTEVVALLTFIAEQAPEKQFIPRDPLERARCYELLSFISSRVHPAFAQVVRPERFSPVKEDHARVTAHGVKAYADSLVALDAMLRAAPYALGERFTVIDPYVLVFWNCAHFVGIDVTSLTRLSQVVAATLERRAVQRTLGAEGLPMFLPVARASTGS